MRAITNPYKGYILQQGKESLVQKHNTEPYFREEFVWQNLFVTHVFFSRLYAGYQMYDIGTAWLPFDIKSLFIEFLSG